MNGALRNMTSLYLFRQGRLLLLWRVGSRVVDPCWCGVGGHFEPSELNDAKAAVLREMKEEIGLSESDLDSLALRYVTLRLKNGEIRQNYYFFAALSDHASLPQSCSEGQLAWFSPEETASLSMPHTAASVLAHYLRVGRFNQTLYAGVAVPGGVTFEALEEF